MNILNLIKTKIYYRQHPDTALRYLPIIEILKNHNLLNSHILEIGSGSYGITPYLKRPVTGVDTDFSEPEFSLLLQIPGNALDLPFPDHSFDVCLFSDVLEHISPVCRMKAISEAVRVARQFVIISGPFGELSFAQDKNLSRYSHHPYFKDHLEYGLPDFSIINDIQNLPDIKSVQVVNHSLNLTVRYWMMRLYLAGKIGYYLYLKALMPFIFIIKHLNSPPCYRSIILIELSHLGGGT